MHIFPGKNPYPTKQEKDHLLQKPEKSVELIHQSLLIRPLLLPGVHEEFGWKLWARTPWIPIEK